MNSELLASNVRKHILNMTSRGGSSHIGSCLSIVDVLSVLYANVLKYEPLDPNLLDRDRFILSKGHAGAAVYATLAEVGFFPTSKLETHYQNGSDLSGHVSHKNVPGVEFSTGSLGHGLSVSCGLAYSAKLNNEAHKIYCVLSDGECDEGSNWEAILFAAHHCLDNLTVIIDYNKLQSLKSVEETLNLEPFEDKWVAFGWEVIAVDGHNHDELRQVFYTNDIESSTTKPKCVIAHTTKGKGISFMENSVLWHYRTAKGNEYEQAMAELMGEENA